VIPIFRAKITSGVIIFEHPQDAYKYIETLEGKYVEVTVRKERSQRSLKQNSYYHGVVVKLLSDFTGYEQGEMHEILKHQFLKKVNPDGFEYVKSTAKLNTTEFEEYLENIKRWGAFLGCVIPDPNEAEA
jgi:hypothetical protein